LPTDLGTPVPIDEMRVLVFAPRGRDAALTVAALAKEGVAAIACLSVATLCAEMLAGAGTAILSEEALEPGAIAMLASALEKQPAWSDFPLILFGDATPEVVIALDAATRALGNVTILERPVRLRTMIGTVRTALRARGRQYGGRAALRSRDQFLAMLGHELRNPLAAVRMAIELLERHPGDRAAQARHTAVIERQSRHLARLVDDLLDVARVTYGKVALEQLQVVLSDVLHGVVLAYDHLARASGLSVSTHIADGLVVKGDRVRLDQVFGNLLANALKYTPREGSVVVDAHAGDGEVVVTLADSGIGSTQPRCRVSSICSRRPTAASTGHRAEWASASRW
jgi:signal transduction histidine kinase